MNGEFCTALLYTRDIGAAGRHYSAVFGWELDDEVTGGSFTLRGQRVAGACADAGTNDGWIPYMAVADIDVATEFSIRNGGTVVETTDPSETSPRRTVVRDPEGNAFGVCASDDPAAATLIEQPGAVCWIEVRTNMPAVLQKFYGALFQWRIVEKPLAPHPIYGTLLRGDTPVAGILPIGPGWSAAPRWQVLFAVENLEQCVGRALIAGGEVEFGPLDVPKAGRLTSVRDPHGAAYVLMQPRRRDPAETDPSV